MTDESENAGSVDPGSPRASARRLQQAAWSPEEASLLRIMGQRVRTARRARKMTIAQLAAVVGVDSAYLGEVERGRANISVLTLDMLGRALGVGAAAMLDGSATE
jgi:XRE family aerobic/anaerobic benzoate catabolism transcriptional regulator